MSSKWIEPCFKAGIVWAVLVLYTYPGLVTAFNGPHILGPSPCDICHIPHHAADDLLWARTTSGPFVGVKRLCESCHGTGLYGAKDRFGIFESEGDKTYDHVMGRDASINGPSITRKEWGVFPLKEKEGGDGFYCGTCHDPHRDPYDPVDDSGGGDYLRQEREDLIKGIADKDSAFCVQCHKELVAGDAYGHGSRHGCVDCHHPHNSVNPGPTILISPIVSFAASPNCKGFSDIANAAGGCYGCHREGSGFDGGINAPLAGDDLPMPMEHHSMGTGANATTSGHQPTQAGPLSPAGELYCGSCHTVHDGTNDHYLNPAVIPKFDPSNSGEFCVACHSDKELINLGPRGAQHHQISPYNQCLFCHSIHNAHNDPDALYQTDEDEATQDNSSASVDVIMRIAPVNLAWSDKNLDTDTRDYEDACYGCHFSPDIVGSEYSMNEENALLFDNVRDRYFSHRFNAVPTAAIKTLNTFDDRLPIVSDGHEDETIDDYGVEQGKIWCGSCHNVHHYERFTEEIPEDYKEKRSAYLRAENYGSSFCYRCHTGYHDDLGRRNHPQDKPLAGGVPIPYYPGYSGGIGGFTNGTTAFDTAQGEVVCQTCHSVHTARADWDGGANEDNLFTHGRLLVNPLDQGFCRDCHPAVHSGSKGNCLICHSPHHGVANGMLIFFVDANIPFHALPNVPVINDDTKDPNFVSSALCYACHQPSHLVGENLWRQYGAAPIYGDIIKGHENTAHKRNHHPMGSETRLSGTIFLRARGAPATENLNKNNEITCISCHDGLHGGEKGNNFLRWNFTNDNPEFCLKCHIDKNMGSGDADLKTIDDQKHFWSRKSDIPQERRLPERVIFEPGAPPDYERETPCLQCMFCHFIHDGEERLDEGSPGAISADIDALMRVAPKKLIWGDRISDAGYVTYESMCYGCHSDTFIAGGGGKEGSLFKWADDLYTHPFASSPNGEKPPSKVINYGGVFPKSDGQGTETKNDYGTEAGNIFCGTCHNVHDGRVVPYLNHPPGLNLSPYEPYSFCESCHDAQSDTLKFVHTSHPIDEGPDYPATAQTWPELYYTSSIGNQRGGRGGNTSDGSFTGNIICLSCHNVHAAATSQGGGVPQDPNGSGHGKLIVRDNKPDDGQGSDMCKDCHNF